MTNSSQIRDQHTDIAIIGMSCLFPGATCYNTFWNNLIQGKNLIQEIPADRWDANEFYNPLLTSGNKMASKWGGFLDDISSFDNKFFDILPDEAKNMDPQSRLLLQETWHAIEDAAISLDVLQKARTSVYTGIFSLDHFQHMARLEITDLYAAPGSYPCMSANRISHFLQLKGASFSLDAACASSLVALHEAKLALQNNLCDYAIVGSANLISHPWHNISMSKGRMLSPDGQCKTFDKKANGYVRGEGVAVLLLTKKEIALENQYQIHALLKGSAVNHCGATRAVTTPNPEAQKEVIRLALGNAGVRADEVDYIEAHGTGTSLGDAMECGALAEVFSSKKNDKLFIGSVKTNIGHLEATAGLAGLLKVILMLKHRTIPPHINMQEPNPLIDFQNSPLAVTLKSIPFGGEKRLLAGISSLGFGGVNSHAIVEEYIPRSTPERRSKSKWIPLILSAHSESSLKNLVNRWSRSNFLETNSDDISYSLLTGRRHFAYRTALLVNSTHSQPQELVFPTPLPLQPKKKIALNIGTYDPKILKDLEPLFSLVFDEEQIEELKVIDAKYYSYLAAYIVSTTFIKLGIDPKIIIGQKTGQVSALVLSGALDCRDAFKFIDLRKVKATIEKPSKPFVDNSTGAIVYPNSIDRSYCEGLRNWLLGSDFIEDQLLKSTLALVDDQMILKRSLMSMDKPLKTREIDLFALMRTYHSGQTVKEANIVNLALMLGLENLYKKYQIKPLVASNSDRINELCTLVSEDIIDFAQVINSINDEEAFYKLFVSASRHKNFKSFRDGLEPRNKNELKIDFDIDRVTDFNNEEMKEVLFDCEIINIGESPGIPSALNNPQEIISHLIQLWREGHDLSWEKFAKSYLNPTQKHLSLPSYEFDKTRFWCDNNNKHKLGVLHGK